MVWASLQEFHDGMGEIRSLLTEMLVEVRRLRQAMEAQRGTAGLDGGPDTAAEPTGSAPDRCEGHAMRPWTLTLTERLFGRADG